MVQEIHQVLMDREDTCHRTCFSLHLDGNMLDHFSELRSVEGLQEGSVLRVVEGSSGSWAACQGRARRGGARWYSTHPGRYLCVTDECVEAQSSTDLVEAGLEPSHVCLPAVLVKYQSHGFVFLSGTNQGLEISPNSIDRKVKSLRKLKFHSSQVDKSGPV